MRIDRVTGATLALLLTFSSAVSAEDSDIELLRSAIDELRTDYDARIADLERRLAVAEQNAMQASYTVPEQPSASGSGASAFNPAIGV
ncbi:MAG: hypothetical protein MUO51_08585, partial [Woeseiaceae bacterium]|nr:hypothetical protein [Woeseiaceae bacterium]